METRFRVGDWVVTPDRLSLHLPGKTVHITPKSMAVLQCLAAAAGQVALRNDILDAVWPGAAVTDDVLTQCIVELRKAFDDSASEPQFIETIPKRGFRLVAPVSTVEADPRPRRPLLLFVAAIVAIAIAGAVYVHQARQVPPDAPKTIAVLPFADLSPAGDQGFFTDGLTEQLIDNLARLDGLEVTAKASSLALKERRDDLQAIGEQLGVSYLLDGSVRQQDEELRVTAKLTHVGSGLLEWSHTYAVKLEDLFVVQEKIAEAVATALSIGLQVGDLAAIEGGTDSIVAYQAYLEGKAAYLGEKPRPLQSVEHYERATERDPGFALAWARLAEACHLASWGERTIGTSGLAERADDAIKKALSLAPQSREVLLIQAQLQIWKYQFAEARLVLDSLHRRSKDPDVRYTDVDLDLALKTGRIDDAFRAIKSVMRHDPLNPHLPTLIAHAYFIQGRIDDALAERERAYQSGNRTVFMANVTVPIALATGRRDEIEKWLRRAHEDVSFLHLGETTNWEVLADNLDDRDAMLEIGRRAQSTPSSDWIVTAWAAWLGEDEMALRSMQRTPDVWFMWTPLLEQLRKTDEFKQVVIDIGLVDYWREFGWGEFCKPTEGDDFECR